MTTFCLSGRCPLVRRAHYYANQILGNLFGAQDLLGMPSYSLVRITFQITPELAKNILVGLSLGFGATSKTPKSTI